MRGRHWSAPHAARGMIGGAARLPRGRHELGLRRAAGQRRQRAVRRAPQGGPHAVGGGRAAGRVDEARAQGVRAAVEAQLVGVGPAGPHGLGARPAGVV